jgi:hypothetical protein
VRADDENLSAHRLEERRHSTFPVAPGPCARRTGASSSPA